jgi:hypothetical protein
MSERGQGTRPTDHGTDKVPSVNGPDGDSTSTRERFRGKGIG